MSFASLVLLLPITVAGATVVDRLSDRSVVVQSDDFGQRALVRRPDATNTVPSPGRMSQVAGNWSALGPFGGDIADVASSPVDPALVLAGLVPSSGAAGTLFRSTDGGNTWTTVSALDGHNVYDIEFTSTGDVWIGTNDGPWRSTNGGITWTASNLGIGINDETFAVAIDPSNEQTVYVGIADAFGNQPNNVMRTTNNGATWTNITPPTPAQSCRGIAVHPTDSNRVYAVFGGAFGGGSIWVTTNGAASWVNRSVGVPDVPVQDISHDGSRILVTGGQNFGSQFFGLYESFNEGATWTALHDATWPNAIGMNAVTFDAADPNNVYVASAGSGLLKSTDGGSTWTIGAAGTKSLSTNSVRFAPGSSTQMYVGASSVAVLQSSDGGNHFVNTSFGIGALNVVSVAASPLDATEMAIAFQGLNDGGVFTSVDQGTTWSLEPLPGTRYNTVAFSPSGVLYAISDGPTTIGAEGLYRRNANGSWTSLGPNQGPQFESELFPIQFSQTNPNLIYTAGSDFGVAGNEPTIWRTTNAGAAWTKVYEGIAAFEDVTDVEIIADGTDQTVLASFTDSSADQTGGVLRSTDGGSTWATSTTGLNLGTQGTSLAVSPTDPLTLYLSDNQSGPGNGGVFRSINGGQSWTNLGLGAGVLAVETDAFDPNRLYILQFFQPVVRMSEDAGTTFVPFANGLEQVGNVRSLSRSDQGIPALLLGSTTGSYRNQLATSPAPAPPLPEDGLGIACAADSECTNTAVCLDSVCYVPKNRYLSALAHPANAGLAIALRVSLVTGGSAVLGWVGEPNPNGVSRVVPTPFYTDWNAAAAVIQIADCEVAPDSIYAIQAIAEGQDIGNEAAYSAALTLPTASWGDTNGPRVAGLWTPPEGVGNFDDIFALVFAFQNTPEAPPQSWADIDGEVPNGVVNNADVLFAIVGGLQGNPYPFAAPQSCP